MNFDKYWLELKNTLRENNFHVNEVNNKLGETIIQLRIATKEGANTICLFVPDTDSGALEIAVLNIMKFENASENLRLHQLVAKFNHDYRCGKLYIYNNEARIMEAILLSDTSDPRDAIRIFYLIYDALEEFYPELMKLKWA